MTIFLPPFLSPFPSVQMDCFLSGVAVVSICNIQKFACGSDFVPIGFGM